MSSTPFGEHLKREREMRGVSLEEISAATRISTRFLAALESEQWDQLPGGVFNRGFIRSVARFLGLDEESLVSEYSLETKSANITTAVVPPPALSRRVPWSAVTSFVVLAAILAAGWFAYARYGARLATLLHRRPAPASASDLPGPPPSTAVAPKSADGSPPASPRPAPAIAVLTAKSVRSALGQDASQEKINQPAPVPGDALELKMEAGKPADVTIVADGQTVFHGHVEASEVKRFTAREAFEISSSESSALFLELNGQTLPPIGQPGEPGNITVTRKDLKSAAGGPH
jgi:cytoskeleton protein RodZ